ncbi:MAG: hypothetical protein KBC69_00995 [Candidatus Magasanikbacteria bacterium]|nr:hypothetical protein [Candidatus Magasanikbacteria bacterium]
MGERGGSKNWSEFLEAVDDESSAKDLFQKKFVPEKPVAVRAPKVVETKKSAQTTKEQSGRDADEKSAADKKNAENSLYLTVLKGERVKRLPGESNDDFKNRKINDRGQRQYEAALRKLGEKLKIDLTRSGAVDLLRASYRNKLAEKVKNGKPKEKEQSLRVLSRIFGITDEEEIKGILDLGLEDDNDHSSSTWLSGSEESKERVHMIGLVRLALNGDEAVKANLEQQYGIEGTRELMSMVKQLGLLDLGKF